jgi:hypothetical protein
LPAGFLGVGRQVEHGYDPHTAVSVDEHSNDAPK